MTFLQVYYWNCWANLCKCGFRLFLLYSILTILSSWEYFKGFCLLWLCRCSVRASFIAQCLSLTNDEWHLHKIRKQQAWKTRVFQLSWFLCRSKDSSESNISMLEEIYEIKFSPQTTDLSFYFTYILVCMWIAMSLISTEFGDMKICFLKIKFYFILNNSYSDMVAYHFISN